MIYTNLFTRFMRELKNFLFLFLVSILSIPRVVAFSNKQKTCECDEVFLFCECVIFYYVTFHHTLKFFYNWKMYQPELENKIEH